MGECDAKVECSLRDGANVPIWFSANLILRDGVAMVGGALPNMTCVAAMVQQYPDVVHMVSIGGWNSPLPSTFLSSTQWFRAWRA